MSLIALFLTALALSMDALAVAITTGIALRKRLNLKRAVKVGIFFGGFQALMPLIGYMLGQRIRHLIASLDHWAAFLMLGVIGGKLLYDAVKCEQAGVCMVDNPTATGVLLPLAVATSIDALAVGISLAMTGVDIYLCVALIGVITFSVCVVGVMLGKQLQKLLRNYAGMAGGVILILIGIKILAEHLIKGI